MRGLRFMCGALGMVYAGLVFAAAEQAPVAPPVFATVEDEIITLPEYQATLQQVFRERYYHFNPPEAEKEKVRREIGQNLIDRILLSREADRQGIQPDTAAVQKEIERYEARYRNSPQWPKMREQALPGLRAHLERKTRLDQLEAAVKQVPPADETTLRDFYAKNLPLFTEPERVKLSMILLKVDPSSPGEKWNKAHAEASTIIGRFKQGEDFAGLAKAHSQDDSAERGGDMGYMHKGMMPEAVQAEVDKLQADGAVVPEPVRLLEGVAVVRMDHRQTARQRAFEDVKGRAADLWAREQAQKNWDAFLEKLRASARVSVNEEYYRAK